MQLYLGQSRIGWVSLPAIQEHPWDVRASLVRLVGVRCLTLGHYNYLPYVFRRPVKLNAVDGIGIDGFRLFFFFSFCMSLCLCEGPAANNCLLVCIFSKKPDMSSVGSILASSSHACSDYFLRPLRRSSATG